MSKKTERLGSVRNGWPVIAIAPDLLEKLEAEEDGQEQLVLPRESVTTADDSKEKVVKPKLNK